MTLTREQVGALIAASEAATEGPWIRYWYGSALSHGTCCMECAGDDVFRTDGSAEYRDEDMQFIAQSRNLMPQLAEEWKQQKDELQQKDAENRRMREALERVTGRTGNIMDLEVEWVPIEVVHEVREFARQALADIDGGRPTTPQQSLEQSLKEMQDIRNGDLPKTTWDEFQRELDAESTWTLEGIVEQLESCGYECIAGPLRNNVAFIALKEMVKRSRADAEEDNK